MKYELKFLSSKFYNSERASNEKNGLFLIFHKNQIVRYFYSQEELKDILITCLCEHIKKYRKKDFKLKIHRDVFDKFLENKKNQKYSENNVWMRYKLIFFESAIEKLKKSIILFHKGEIIQLFLGEDVQNALWQVLTYHKIKLLDNVSVQYGKSFYIHIPKTCFNPDLKKQAVENNK